MAIRQYTREELIALSRSKLVTRPDNLPAIEQWIEYVYSEQDGKREKLRIAHSEQTQNVDHERHKSGDAVQGKGKQTRAAGLAGAAEGSPMGAFSTGRPTQTSRSSTLRTSGEDVSLGPPRNTFPSSRNVPKPLEILEKSDGAGNDESDHVRSRFFSDRQLNRRGGGEKDGAETKNRWSSVRERRQVGDGEDEKRAFGRHDKDNEGERRNGYGQKEETRWGRDDRTTGTRTGGGWREREAARREREYQEKEPEWMDDSVVKKDQELGFTAWTQDDFEEWKRQMAGKPKIEKEEDPVPESAPVPAAEPKPILKLDGFDSGFFGAFGGGPAITPGASTPAVGNALLLSKAAGKGKTSRFASMFKPVEPSAPLVSVGEPQPPSANAGGPKTAEDQEGFNRVLVMLGGTKINQPPAMPEPVRNQPPAMPEPVRNLTPSYGEPVPTSPPYPFKITTSIGTLPGGHKSRFTGVFAQERTPGHQQMPQPNSPPFPTDNATEGSSRGLPEEPSQLFTVNQPERQPSDPHPARIQAPEATNPSEASGIPFNALREQQPRPSSGRPVDPYNRFDPPSRGVASPDRNIADLLAQQPRHRVQTTSSQSQDLLNLLKNPKSLHPPSQTTLPTNDGIDQAELERWLTQQKPLQTHGPTQTLAPKPRGPQQPPGMFEEQLMRNYGQDQQRHEQIPLPQDRIQPPRPPPGFYNINAEPKSLLAHQQRHAHQQAQQIAQQQAEREAQQAQLRRQHQYAELAQRQQQMQQQQQQQQRRPTEQSALQQVHMLQQYSQADFQQPISPVGGAGGIAPPPPGFNQIPRYPPGFANNQTFLQQPTRDQPPPGFNSGPVSPPGFFGGPPNLPPGFHAAQQMRSPIEGPSRWAILEELYARR